MNGYQSGLCKFACIAATTIVVTAPGAVQGQADISGWRAADIGIAESPGSHSIADDGTITVFGSGNDVWGTEDNFYFVYKAIHGDATLITQVHSVEPTDPWAKGAIMFRETLEPDSANVALDLSAHNSVAFQWRPIGGERSWYWGRKVAAPPVWLKLERSGNVFTGAYSTDGVNWLATTSETVPMDEEVYVGLAASPHVTTGNNEVVFSGFDVLRDLPTSGLWTPGITATAQTSLPDDEPLACEWDWTIGQLALYPNYDEGHMPRRMYMASCGTDTPNPTVFTSYTVGTKVDAGYTGTSGAITASAFNPQTGALEVQETHHFPECRSMHGVATRSDCGLVAALCRIPNTATGADYDAVDTFTGSDWMTNENTCNGKMNDHMWLYEWPDGDLTKVPTKIIVHKSIGSWEYGSNYLRYGEVPGSEAAFIPMDSYGISLKATVGPEGGCHEADSFTILNRATYEFSNTRGWQWACAHGHTIHNRVAYDPPVEFDPRSRKQGTYAVLCSTDWNDDGIADEAELAFRLDDGQKDVIQHLPRMTNNANYIKGAAGPIIARDGGGFLGIFVGEPPPGGAGYDDTTPVQLGLVSYDASGARLGGVVWVASDPVAYYSWPQLASLGDDRYLLAWGEGYHAGTKTSDVDRNLQLRVPSTYWMMEIDGDGNKLTSPQEVTNAGWGERNEMVSLGDGRVAWSFVPDDRLMPGATVGPDCNQDTLMHYVYTSSTQPTP